MKYLITLLLLLPIISYNIFAQTFGKVYEHPKMYGYVAKHKQIAIIPFNYKIALKRMPKRMTQEDVVAAEKAGVISAQNSLEIFILNKKKKGRVNIELQDVNRTNALLKRAKVDIYNVFDFLPEELCEILEVDAVILGTINSSKIMSKGAAIAMQLLIGASVSDKAKVSISVYDKDGTRIWNYGKEISGSAFANDDDLIRIVMRKTSRRFPYMEN